ncbi:hypothetical protein JCGZ_01784 [Jatropha curcas]|uniref:Uncharacterized protein n=1 Tax=Jatropha curcas TaxID=180498 RepID=A0A067LDF2_JATCU|nr:hypothetical protein JCGZ_01784 [Jatropha curcas]
MERKKHRTPAYYRAEAEAEAEAEAAAPVGPAGAVMGDVPFPPGMEVVMDPTLGLGSAIISRLTSDRLLHHCSWILSMPHTCQLRDTRSCAGGLGSPRPTLLDSILRVMRSAVTRLQLEVDRLWTRLEVEGIPLDFSEDEEDVDGSSSDDAQPSPPPQAAAGPSRRRR